MLSIQNITKAYSGGTVKAVDNLCLDIHGGEIFGFLGPNGAGKTTTIKMITGILPIDIGRIMIDGIDIMRNPIEFKKHIGYVSDDHIVYDKLTGREYIDFICDVYGVSLKDRQERAEALLKLFNLSNDFDSQISTYSHGMKQKISVIAALVHKPKVWILDEPLTGLDPQSSFDLKNLMRTHAKEGNIVFFSTHILEVAERLCDRVGIINKGKLIKVGKLEDIKENSSDKSLEEVFLKITSNNANYSNAPSYENTDVKASTVNVTNETSAETVKTEAAAKIETKEPIITDNDGKNGGEGGI